MIQIIFCFAIGGNRAKRIKIDSTINNVIKLIRTAKEIGISFSRKQTSEFMSSIVESAFVESGKLHDIKVVAPKVDHEPDLYIDNMPLEIKTKHKVSGEWRGGAFSKRSCEYLFVSYNIIDNYLTSGVEWFAIQKYVEENKCSFHLGTNNKHIYNCLKDCNNIFVYDFKNYD